MAGIGLRFLPADPASRAATFSVLLNVVSVVVKIAVGVISGSVAVLSDGIDSLEDLIASGIALASLRYGARPPDRTHPYGHGSAETIAATVQAVLIGGGGVFILFNAVRRLLNPPDAIDTEIAIVTMLVAAAANLALLQYTSRVARETGSPAIASEARHLMTNVVQAVGVTVGLVAVLVTGVVALDGVIALALGCYLLWISGGILKSSIGEVLDRSLDPEELEELRATIASVADRTGGFHDLRTRRFGQVRQIDFHMTFPQEMTVEESHVLTVEVEGRITGKWPGSVVIVHAEPPPAGQQDPRL